MHIIIKFPPLFVPCWIQGRRVCSIQLLGVPFELLWSHSWGDPLIGGLLCEDFRGVLALVEGFFDIYRHVDVQYACFLVPVQCNDTVESPCPVLCDLIIILCCIYEMLGILFFWYFFPKSSTTSVKVIPFLLCLHNPGLMGIGS